MISFLFFLKDVKFRNFYNETPNVFVSADHSSKGGNLSPAHNGITAWIEVGSLIYNFLCDTYNSKLRDIHLHYDLHFVMFPAV